MESCFYVYRGQVIDFQHEGVSKHIGHIADFMYEWEGPVAEQLSLTLADVATIKTKYPTELKLQTYVRVYSKIY